VFVSFDDEAVADYFDQQVDAGLRPDQFGRIWVHTHPGDCPQPSPTDEETFARVFGDCQWAVMFILARDGASYARMRFNPGPVAEAEIPVEIDFSQPFAASDEDAWANEYEHAVTPQRFARTPRTLVNGVQPRTVDEEDGLEEWRESWWDYLSHAEQEELLYGEY